MLTHLEASALELGCSPLKELTPEKPCQDRAVRTIGPAEGISGPGVGRQGDTGGSFPESFFSLGFP